MQIRPSHVFERCTNPTFSHIHVSHTYLQPTKVLASFGVLRKFSCSSLFPRAVSRHLRSPKEVIAKLRRSWPLGLCFRVTNPRLRSPEGAISHLLRCFIGSSPRACAPPWLAFTFGSEGEAFAPRCLSWLWAPFGRSCRPTPEPCRQVRRCF